MDYSIVSIPEHCLFATSQNKTEGINLTETLFIYLHYAFNLFALTFLHRNVVKRNHIWFSEYSISLKFFSHLQNISFKNILISVSIGYFLIAKCWYDNFFIGISEKYHTG